MMMTQLPVDVIGRILEFIESPEMLQTCVAIQDIWANNAAVVSRNLFNRLGGKNALIRAADCNQADVCKCLLDLCEDNNDIAAGAHDALWLASIWSNTDVVRCIMSDTKLQRCASMDATDVLSDVIGSCDDVDVCRILLDRDICGERVARADSDMLERAASDGSIEICQVLLSNISI